MVKSLNEELSQLNSSMLSNKKDSEDKILKLEYDITEERKFNSTRKDMTTKLEHKMSEVTEEKELLKEKIKNLENALNINCFPHLQGLPIQRRTPPGQNDDNPPYDCNFWKNPSGHDLLGPPVGLLCRKAPPRRGDQ